MDNNNENLKTSLLQNRHFIQTIKTYVKGLKNNEAAKVTLLNEAKLAKN